MPNPSFYSRSPRRGFTLTELLVAVTILVVLAALAFPAIQGAIHQSKVTESMSRMRQLGVAVNLFSADNKNHFPGSGNSASQRWFHQVAPYLGYEADAQASGVPVYTRGYEIDEIYCPVLSGQSVPGGSGTYLARFGLNRNLTVTGQVLGIKRTRVTNPGTTVMIVTKANGAPNAHYGPYPDHGWGVAGNYQRNRSPEEGMEEDGFIGSHAYVFCDGHIEKRDHFIGAEAFDPAP